MYNSEEYIFNNKTDLLQHVTGSDFLALFQSALVGRPSGLDGDK
jgi:hypothetical protein